MHSRDPPAERGPDETPTDENLRRRRFLALGAAAAVPIVAGCASDPSSPSGPGGSASGGGGETGTFRLLISDQPVAIDEFDELNVSFDRARIFRADGADDDGDDEETETPEDTETETETATETATETETETETATETETETETATETETETENGDDEEDDDGERAFFVIDLDGATVDLTQVVGEKAIGVFDGELSAGRYTKIELYAAGVEGIVDGEPVDVKIPSGKLQIVKPFEVVAGETLSFVFDINVVKKGPTGGYNLLPVISKSGVAGEDVEVEEIDVDDAGPGGAGGADTEAEENDDDAGDDDDEDDGPDGGNPGGGGGGPPDGAGENS